MNICHLSLGLRKLIHDQKFLVCVFVDESFSDAEKVLEELVIIGHAAGMKGIPLVKNIQWHFDELLCEGY